MDNIRIGNTFEVSWAINQFDGTETVPYDLAGKDLTLILANALSKVRVEKFSVIGNIISFTFEGKDQRHAGKYSLILIENNGVDGMHMVDVCDAFRLVNRSCETCDDPSSIVDCTHIDFASTMLSRRGISAYEYAKLNGYEGTEEEYAAECRAIPELKDQVQEIVDKAAEDIQAAIESFDKTLQGKQDTIEDLETIRSGAAKGATAVQNVSSSNANYATVRREGFEWIISPRTQKISEAGDPVFYKSGIADAYDVKQELIKKVDKVVGKQLSTEDFTTALKQKLQGLSNYDDSTLTSAINSLQSQINTLVSGNVSSAIDTFNEIIAFLDGVKDTQDLAGIIASIEQQIAGVNSSLSAELAKKPNKTDIATINGQSLIEGGNIVIEGKNYDAEIAARNVGAVDVEGGAEAPDAPGGSYDDTEIQAKLIELSAQLGNINAKPMISVTYAELVALRDNGELIAGMQYRITDYVTTTAQENTRSAGHQFDVIVTADNENTLNEVARACLHEGDTYFSEAGANLAAWQIWYSLDNDTQRFAWADTENGKGVIYRMIDEWNNDIPYDFKNIQFKRNLIFENGYAEYSEDGKKLWIYTFAGQSYHINNDEFSDMLDGSLESPFGHMSDENTSTFHDNTIKPYIMVYNGNDIYTECGIRYLNDIVFLGYWEKIGSANEEDMPYYYAYCCHYNSFNYNCHSNSFDHNCYGNSFGNDCSFNSFGNYCYFNSFGNGCRNNSFGNDYRNNSFGNECHSNSFGNGCSSNSFGNDCSSNSFGNYCITNTLGNGCTDVTLDFNTYDKTASRNSNGEVKVFNLADLADLLNS